MHPSSVSLTWRSVQPSTTTGQGLGVDTISVTTEEPGAEDLPWSRLPVGMESGLVGDTAGIRGHAPGPAAGVPSVSFSQVRDARKLSLGRQAGAVLGHRSTPSPWDLLVEGTSPSSSLLAHTPTGNCTPVCEHPHATHTPRHKDIFHPQPMDSQLGL